MGSSTILAAVWTTRSRIVGMPSGRSPPPGLRDHYPPHRTGPVRLRNQFLAQARQPRLQALLLDLRESHPVHARRARIGAGKPVGVSKNVFAANLVVEQIEAEVGLRLRLARRAFSEGSGSLSGVSRLIANHLILTFFKSVPEVRDLPSTGVTRLRRSYAPVRLPPYHRQTRRRGCDPRQHGSPPLPGLPSYVPCPLPRRIGQVHVSIASPSARPSPNSGGSASALSLFEACSGFTRVTARRIAQPPKAAFVTGLRPSQLPGQAARQLPAQSTTLWVEPSSTGVSRLRGAPEKADIRVVDHADSLGLPDHFR